MNSGSETNLPAIPETPRAPVLRTLPVLVISLLAVLAAGAIAVGIFELTRQSFSSHQTWNTILVGVTSGLIATLGSIMWFHYSSREAQDRYRDQTLSDPLFNIKFAEALTGVAQLFDDGRSKSASNIAGLNALLSLGRVSAESAGACADVIASFIRHRKNRSEVSSEDFGAGSSCSELELAINVWSQLARRGFDTPRRLDLSRLTLNGVQLRNLTLTGANLAGADLNDSDISGSDLRGADLTGANLSHSVAVGVRFQQATLVKANLTASTLRDSDFSGALLTAATFDKADLRRTRFVRALLPDANLRRADLTEADLRDALMMGVDLTDAIVIDAILDGAAISPDAEGSISGIRHTNHVVRDSNDLQTWASQGRGPGASDE